MSDQILQENQADEETFPFLSITSLRSTHRELLQERRDNGETSEFHAAISEFLRRGEAAGAYLDEDEDRWAAQNLLDYWENELYHAGLEPPECTLAEFDPDLQPEIPDELCPYVGLGAFQESEHDYFYGRTQLIDNLLQQLNGSRLVAVIGPSGSGKSSVVLAGLLPRLYGGSDLPGSQNWHYFPPIVAWFGAPGQPGQVA